MTMFRILVCVVLVVGVGGSIVEFPTINEVLTPIQCDVPVSMPDSLDGSRLIWPYYATYDVKQECGVNLPKLTHLFDGFVGVAIVSFDQGNVTFVSRRLETKEWIACRDDHDYGALVSGGEVTRKEAVTILPGSLRYPGWGPSPAFAIPTTAGMIVGGVGNGVLLNTTNGETIRTVKSPALIRTPHPAFDDEHLWHFDVERNLIQYKVVKWTTNPGERQIVSPFMPTWFPNYCDFHSPFLTKHWLILPCAHFKLRISEMWSRPKPAKVFLMSREDPSQVVELKGELLEEHHMIHSVGGWEDDDGLVHFITTADRLEYYDAFRVPFASTHFMETVGTIQHCVLNPVRSSIRCDAVVKHAPPRLEFPLSPRTEPNEPVTHFWALSFQSPLTSYLFDRVVRVDVERGQVVATYDAPAGRVVSEASHVGSGVDQIAWLESDHERRDSWVVIADSTTLEERYRIPTPEFIPFHIHGIGCLHGRCDTNPVQPFGS